jgi:hypothetical protein
MASAEREFATEVENQRCEEFRVQQFWFESRLADEWNVLFLKLRSGWVRFFFDAGAFFWKRESPSLPEKHEKNEYRLVRPDVAKVIEGHTILAASFSHLSSGGRTLSLNIDSGSVLHLHNKHDRSSIVLVGAHAT